MYFPVDSVFLISLLIGYFYYSIRAAKKERTQVLSEPKNQRIEVDIKLRRAIFLFIIGAACVIFGSRWLVNSAELIARKLGVPDLVISVTLVAVGTSLPEYVTALTATIKGYQEISIGNIMGADIMDIVWVLGASSMLSPLPIQLQTKVLDFPFMLVLMILLTTFAKTRSQLSRLEGSIFFLVYTVYLLIMFLKFTTMV